MSHDSERSMETNGLFGVFNLIFSFSAERWRGQWQSIPVLLPGESHGWRSLVGCSLWGCEESDTTKRLHFHFSLSCIGEGNGNPFQCSCLESPRDRGAWWAAVYGVVQSRTWLKWLSSSSSSSMPRGLFHSVQSNLYCAEFLSNLKDKERVKMEA